MNDVVLNLDTRELALPLELQRFRSLSLSYVLELGQELFASFPRLQHDQPEKAKRLALLIAARHPEINAALFVAPAQGCGPAEVSVRYCQIGVEVMASLLERQNAGRLDPVATDNQVWRRFAA